MNDLEMYREQLALCDDKIIDALAERNSIIEKIMAYKEKDPEKQQAYPGQKALFLQYRSDRLYGSGKINYFRLSEHHV